MLKQTVFSIFRNWELVREMAVRDLQTYSKGTFLGWLWALLRPLIRTVAYVIIVSFIFGAKLGGNAGRFDYVIYVLSGIVPWEILTHCLQDAPQLIRARMQIVKQVIYPIETLPVSSLFTSAVSSSAGFTIFLILSLITGQARWTFILVPIPFAMLIILVLGVSWIFMVVGVIFKDLREIVGVILGLMVYASPVIAHKDITHPLIWKIILLNPLAHIIICFRDVYNTTFHPWSWLIFSVMTSFAFFLGSWVILKAKIKINEFI